MTVASLVIPAPDSARPHRLARVLGYGVDRMPSPQYADAARYRARLIAHAVLQVAEYLDAVAAGASASVRLLAHQELGEAFAALQALMQLTSASVPR